MSTSLKGKNLLDYVKKASAASFLIKAFGLLLGLGLHVIFARVFGQENYGTYLFLTANIVLIVSLSLLGLDKAALKFIPKYQILEAGRSLAQYVIFSNTAVIFLAVIVSSLFAAVIFYFYSSRFPLLNQSIMVAFVLVAIFTTLSTLYDGFLQAIKKPIHAQLPLQIIKPLCLMAALFLVTEMVADDWLMHFLWLSALLGLGIFLILWIIWGVKRPRLADAVEKVDRTDWLKVGIGFQAITLCNVALTQTDVIVVGSLLDADSVALYGVAVKIASLLTFFLVSINTVVAPIISQYYVEDDKVSLQRLMTFSARIVTTCTLLATLVVLLTAEWALIFFGESYTEAENTLYILCVASCFNAMTGSVSYLLSLSGHQSDVLIVLILSALINLILSVLLVWHIGLIGAAVATTITTLFWNSCLLFVSLKRTGVNPSILPIRTRYMQI